MIERDAYPLIEIRWLDASIDTDDFTAKEAREAHPVDRWTVGYLVAETDEMVVLSTDWYVGKDDEFHSMIRIPWGMVTEYWRIKTGS